MPVDHAALFKASSMKWNTLTSISQRLLMISLQLEMIVTEGSVNEWHLRGSLSGRHPKSPERADEMATKEKKPKWCWEDGNFALASWLVGKPHGNWWATA